MENGTSIKMVSGQPAPKRGYMRWKAKPPRTNGYLDFLAHYDAELMGINGAIAVIRHTTGTELPLDQKGKLLMVKLLLDEFRTVDGINQAIEKYKASCP